MKRKTLEPFIPAERHDTVRREIMSALGHQTLSAKELSASVGISEHEVYGHLEHIRKSTTRKSAHLVVKPAECLKCGFVFSKRERLKKPGKCPVCRNHFIQEPLFSLTASDS